MAIYKNREVFIVGPNVQANTPETIGVSYRDGTHENVSVAQVKFTKEEKDALLKAHPSKYDSVDVVSDEDLKAVRIGVAPSFDEAAKEQAFEEALRQKQAQEAQKQREQMAKEAQKDVDKKINAPVQNPQTPVAKVTK